VSEGKFREYLQRKVDAARMLHGANVDLKESEEIEGLIERLVQKYRGLGVLNDSKLLENKLHAYLRKGRGLDSAKYELSRLKFDKKAVSDKIDLMRSQQDEDADFQRALVCAKKKKIAFVTDSSLFSEENKKHSSKLVRAGFSFDVVKMVFDFQKEQTSAKT